MKRTWEAMRISMWTIWPDHGSIAAWTADTHASRTPEDNPVDAFDSLQAELCKCLPGLFLEPGQQTALFGVDDGVGVHGVG
jgi:hypothetical protein